MAAIAKEWQLIKTIQTNRGSGHHLIGPVGGQSVVLKETHTGDIFDINLGNEETTRVISRTRDAVSKDNLFRCVSLEEYRTEGHLVAFGTRDGNIRFIKNFRQFEWEFSETIIEVVNSNASILLTVAKDGTLMAAAHGSSNIHLYNPNDWSFIRTDPVGAVIIYEMHAMTDGHIAIRTKKKDVCILNVSGAIDHTLQGLHDKDVNSIAVNKANNSILVLYRDRDRDEFVVDVYSSRGELSAQRILSFRKAGVTYPSFLWLNPNRIAVHEDAGGDIYVYSPEGLDLL